MISRVLLTRVSLARALAELEEPWRALAAFPPIADGVAGACVDFFGIVRGLEEIRETPMAGETRPNGASGADGAAVARAIRALDYEAHEAMARHQMEKILAGISGRTDCTAALVIHRIGRVEVGEASLFVRLYAPHRQTALHACAEFIDELKQRVPIWKHGIEADGSV